MRLICDADCTRSSYPAGEAREQGGGDGRILRDGRPVSAPGDYLGITVEDVISYDALWESMMRCRRGVMWKGSVASFVLNGSEQIAKLCDGLHNGTYRPRPAARFTVTSPKRREIVGVSFRDRVFQRSLNDNCVYPLMCRSWIRDNYACQEGKGTDDGRERMRCFLERYYREHGSSGWMLSVDIKGYYPNMRYDVAEACFGKHLPDWAMDMVRGVLAMYPGDVGYNPGSQLVQIAGVSVLSELDHFCKEVLRVKHYGRYMDDIRIVHHDRDYLEFCRDIIGDEAAELGFELHPTKTVIKPLTERNPFLGFDFRIAETGKVVMTVRPDSVKRMRRRVSRLVTLEARGLRPPGTAAESYESWRAHAAKGDSRLLLERYDRWFEGLERP